MIQSGGQIKCANSNGNIKLAMPLCAAEAQSWRQQTSIAAATSRAALSAQPPGMAAGL